VTSASGEGHGPAQPLPGAFGLPASATAGPFCAFTRTGARRAADLRMMRWMEQHCEEWMRGVVRMYREAGGQGDEEEMLMEGIRRGEYWEEMIRRARE